MATVKPSYGNPSGQQGIQKARWDIVGGDDVYPMAWSNLADKTVQVFDIAGDTITIQGSNDPRAGNDDPVIFADAVWETLTDNLGEPLVFDANGLKLIAEAPDYVRPLPGASLSAGTIIIVANAS